MHDKVENDYSYDKILEMMGGDEYFCHNLIDYVYFSLNAMPVDAQQSLELYKAELERDKIASSKFKSPDEIKNV